MPDQFGDKQHEATPHRRQKARQEGQVARSQDLGSAVLLLGALIALHYSGAKFFTFLTSLCRLHFENEAALSTDSATVAARWQTLIMEVGSSIMPLLGSILLIAILAQLGQVGFLFLPQKLALDVSRIDPIRGAQRLFSVTSVMRLTFGIFKIVVVSAVAVAAVWSERENLLQLSAVSVFEIWTYLVEISFWTTVKIGIALLILALLDYGFQRWKHEQDLRMTTQELRDELKENQGDPQVAARRKAVQRQLVLNRLNGSVPDSDTVVTNPTELAIAIKYDPQTMEAPIVTAKGAGVIAQRIRRLALEHGVPIVERKELARALYRQVEVGKPIPPEQYAAMAEVLRYVYELQGKTLPEAAA